MADYTEQTRQTTHRRRVENLCNSLRDIHLDILTEGGLNSHTNNFLSKYIGVIIPLEGYLGILREEEQLTAISGPVRSSPWIESVERILKENVRPALREALETAKRDMDSVKQNTSSKMPSSAKLFMPNYYEALKRLEEEVASYSGAIKC